MSSETLVFDDSASVRDLASFISRAKSIEDDAAQFLARNTALAVYVPVLVPGSLGQGEYTILGMRVHRLAHSAELSACYSLASIQDRLARMGDSSTTFVVPPMEVNPQWAGIQVPLSGWQHAGQLPDAHLKAAARSGINAVAEALPENPGKPVISQVRQRIWSSIQENTDPELPLGAAFAMHALGFLTEHGQSKVYRNGSWLRITSERGHVVLRRSASLG